MHLLLILQIYKATVSMLLSKNVFIIEEKRKMDIINFLLTIIGLFISLCGISIFSLYHYRKTALLKHIAEMLKLLRSMEAWDERSEAKLTQWMQNTDESTLHYRSLIELRNILNGLYSYWAVHIAMEDNTSPNEVIYDFNKPPEKMSIRFIIEELISPEKPKTLI